MCSVGTRSRRKAPAGARTCCWRLIAADYIKLRATPRTCATAMSDGSLCRRRDRYVVKRPATEGASAAAICSVSSFVLTIMIIIMV